MEISKDKLERMLDEYVLRAFGKKFEFRTQQKEVILDIVDAFFDGTCNLYLLDAPTGSGKSIIAMVVAGFLSEFKMRGYILASDLMLQTQYERDFKRNNIQWGSIKGVDNYTCSVNSEKFSLGECKTKNVSYEEAEKLSCFNDCGYLYGRKVAIKSPVSLLNYSFWLIQRNYVEPKMAESGRGIPFPIRDFTLCDEAHKVSDIVQNHFSPRLDDKTLEKLEKLRNIVEKNNLGKVRNTSSRLKIVINNLFREEDPEKILGLLKEFETQLSDFVKAGNLIKDHVANVYKKSVVPKDWRFSLSLGDWAKDMHCKFEDYNHIIANAGIDSMIKNRNGDSLTFNCLDESYMMDRHFHSQAGFKLLMSATILDPATFLKSIGASSARYFKMDSHFDYSNSPIYYYPSHRMSYKDKAKSLPYISNKMEEIINIHSKEKGIIHSGSYELSALIVNLFSDKIKKRIIVYSTSKEKDEAVSKFKASKNSILIGPSLIEGLDFKDDLCRFQIICKIPYPSLNDNFIKAKIINNQEWYNMKTCMNIIQGIGRSVRNEDDYCTSYILDGCMSDLFRSSRRVFPSEFLKRIKTRTCFDDL